MSGVDGLLIEVEIDLTGLGFRSLGCQTLATQQSEPAGSPEAASGILPAMPRRVGPPDRRKQGPIQFLENNPIQSSLWVRFMCPKTRRNWLRLPIVRFHPGSSCPQTAALRRSHTRGRRPPPFSARSRVSWHTVNLRSAHLAPILRTSEHFHVFSPPPRLSVRMFGSGGKKRANASSNCAAL